MTFLGELILHGVRELDAAIILPNEALNQLESKYVIEFALRLEEQIEFKQPAVLSTTLLTVHATLLASER